jgi:hypothetical protein
MQTLVGAAETVRVLPIVVAFFALISCFAAWAALMIRSQRTHSRDVVVIPVVRRGRRG